MTMPENKNRKAGLATILSALVSVTLIMVFIYLAVRTILFITADYAWYEKIVAGFLLLAEFFVMTHSFGYFLNILHVLKSGKPAAKPLPELPTELTSYPPVAILVASYKEPLEVLGDTLTCFYNLTYPNKHLFFLDDTRYDLPGLDPQKMSAYRKDIDELCRGLGVNLFRRKWRGAKAGIINDFLDFIAGREKAGFEYTHLSDRPRKEPEKYLIVFDADMNPFPDFVEPLVARMEEDPKLAFIQTPQYYSNFEHNRVARAAGLQQAVFYEYICEGKSISDAMFCCGTNVIFRREAFEDVGGFDESSVTEDIATSFKFHKKGWRSAYLNKVCAFGMGPEDLGAYFKQQFRWALGTIGLGRQMLIEFFKSPKSLPLSKWWEYFLSGTHYFVGWAFFHHDGLPHPVPHLWRARLLRPARALPPGILPLHTAFAVSFLPHPGKAPLRIAGSSYRPASHRTQLSGFHEGLAAGDHGLSGQLRNNAQGQEPVAAAKGSLAPGAGLHD